MSKPSKEFINPKTLRSLLGYSHIAKVHGGTPVYLAGQVSSDASGKAGALSDIDDKGLRLAVFGNQRLARVETAEGTAPEKNGGCPLCSFREGMRNEERLFE